MMLPLLVLVVAIACKAPQNNFKLKVESIDDAGKSIAWSEVWINQELIGETDQKGKFIKNITLPLDEDIRIEVRKESENRYFAPYLNIFQLTQKSQPKINIKAVLYSVPKGSLDEAVADSDDEEKLEIIQKSDSKTPDSEKVDQEESLVEKAPEKKITQTVKAQPPKKAEPKTENLAPIVAAPMSLPESPANEAVEEDEIASLKTMTVYVFEKEKPLSGSEVYWGDESSAQFQLACKTDRRGSCQFKLDVAAHPEIHILSKKEGYRTDEKKIASSEISRVRFSLVKGETIDIFAINRRYGYNRGIQGIEVFINGIAAGTTDKFGRYSHFYSGIKGDLVEVRLKSESYLPRQFTTDYVVSGPMSLVKYFNPAKPHPVRLSYLPMQAAGRMENKTLSKFGGELDQYFEKTLLT